MKKTLILIATCLLGFAAAAQDVTIYGDVFMPTGNYGKSYMNVTSTNYTPYTAITEQGYNLGGAGWGWGTGIQLSRMVNRSGFGWVADLGFRMGWLNADMRSYFNEYGISHNSVGITKAPKYFNIPLLVGPSFTFDATSWLDIYLALEIGFDVRIISDACYTASKWVDYDAEVPFAFRVAGGFVINDHIVVEANWSWFDEQPVFATAYGFDSYPVSGPYGFLETMQFALRFGYRF